jgi:hypothetical protein
VPQRMKEVRAIALKAVKVARKVFELFIKMLDV